jgi:hypothetical protein
VFLEGLDRRGLKALRIGPYHVQLPEEGQSCLAESVFHLRQLVQAFLLEDFVQSLSLGFGAALSAGPLQ